MLTKGVIDNIIVIEIVVYYTLKEDYFCL